MQDEAKTKTRLIAELEQTRKRVAELEQVEEALRESEEQFRQFFENEPEYCYVISPEGIILIVNTATLEALGYQKEELVGKSLKTIYAPESLPKMKQLLKKRQETGKLRDEELVIITKGGDRRTVLLSSDAMRDSNGKLLHSVSIQRDITERKRVEEVLRIRDKAIASSINAIAFADLDGNLTYVNRSFLDLCGYDDEKEVLGKPAVSFWKVEEKAMEMAEESLSRGSWVGELIAQRKDGSIFDAQLSASLVLDEDGKPLCKMVSFIDITEQKRSEEELREYRGHLEERVKERTVKLEKVIGQLQVEIKERKRAEELIQVSLREKEMLLKEIHHRVNNNLQLISSLIDMSSMRALDQQAIDVYADTRARIHTIALIHSQLYRSERFDQVNMESHIRELVDCLSEVYAIRSRLITTVIELSDVYLTIIQAIPYALVLNEIISNVFRHAFEEGQKGTLEISTQRSADDTILTRIKDDGIGLPEEIDINTTNTLGLMLIRNLVQEQLKGRIQVERDKGTEITVEFQILKEEVEHA